MYADVYPGARVLEAGTGSGALTIALCRAVGEQGRVVSYELREEHRAQAQANVESFFGKIPDRLELRAGDVTEVGRPARSGSTASSWISPSRGRPSRRCARRSSRGPCCAPTCRPRSRSISSSWRCPRPGFLHIETFEVLKRGWHVTERSVRPDHRMVGHTGFLTLARVGPGD